MANALFSPQPAMHHVGRLIYWEWPLDHSSANSTFCQRTDVTSTWFPQDLMKSFVIKKPKTLVGRRGSDLEQAHREQKGKKDTQNFVGKLSTAHKPQRFMLSGTSCTAHLRFIPLPFLPQHWASRLLTQKVPCLFSLQSTPVISSQARLVLPPSCAWPATALTGHPVSLHPTERGCLTTK